MTSISRSYSRGKVNNVIYNDRCGYAIIYYDPIYDLDSKIPPLRMADLPYTIPLQRKSIKSLKPAGKPVGPREDEREVRRPKIPGECEAAKEFIQRKIIERKMDEVREACANIRRCYKKAEKFDLKRREAISPRVKAKIRGKTSDEICDVLVDDVMQNVDYVYERNLEEKGKTSRKLALAALRRAAKAPKPIEKIHPIELKLEAVKEEENSVENNNTKASGCCSKTCLNCAKVCENCSKACSSCTEAPITCSKLNNKALDQELKKSEKKYEELPVEKTIWPSPPRCGLQNYSALKRRHMELMSQRAADSLLFEMTYGRMLRRMKNEIRRLKETYS